MGIVNAGQLDVYDQIDPELREACEDVILDRRGRCDGAAGLLAEEFSGTDVARRRSLAEWRSLPVAERPVLRLVKGHRRAHRRRHRGSAPASSHADRGDRRPSDGRNERRRRPVRVGQDVPSQVVKSARVMKKAVAHLIPSSRREGEATGATQGKGRIVMATVKGDVHDIGKNIVGVVLQCNGFEVIDLGVMVPWQDI
jgi:5-methyltetrahydrofolate--homocysteine methyltransferase